MTTAQRKHTHENHREPGTCPKCGSAKVYRSHRRGIAEKSLTWFGAHMRRCRECRVRFVSIGESAILWKDMDRITKRLASAALVTGGLAGSIWSVWWIINHLADLPL